MFMNSTVETFKIDKNIIKYWNSCCGFDMVVIEVYVNFLNIMAIGRILFFSMEAR